MCRLEQRLPLKTKGLEPFLIASVPIRFWRLEARCWMLESSKPYPAIQLSKSEKATPGGPAYRPFLRQDEQAGLKLTFTEYFIRRGNLTGVHASAQDAEMAAVKRNVRRDQAGR